MSTTAKKTDGLKVPSPHDWRTTDADEINKRRLRAREEPFTISNADPQHPIFSNFRVKSGSGLTYSVEIRDLRQRQFACDCVDFRSNHLGLFNAAQQKGSNRIEVVVDSNADTLRVLNGHGELPQMLKKWFDAEGKLVNPDVADEATITALQQLREAGFPQIRISQEVAGWLENRRRAVERKQLRREYELKVQSGEWPMHETKVPLFPYQREGMLHLAFTERALLADEMGLGKTIQAIAACALLHRLGKAQHALVVTPASLKTEWEEQIQRFTDLPYQLLFGARHLRLKAYDRAGNAGDALTPALSHRMGEGESASDSRQIRSTSGQSDYGVGSSFAPRRAQGPGEGMPFFTIVNYEQMLTDALDVNARLRPDIVVLDEAQRIKNWNTKTAQAVKRLRSRYAFVLTGTPIENRIDELHSLMDFLNPSALGPLFRFNRDFYELDNRGRPTGYRNLDQLHARIKPYLVRRRKADVETELPERTDRNHFVPLSDEQAARYAARARIVLRLVNLAQRRPLTKEEQEKLQRELAMMRMICDTNYILDPDNRDCPKLPELEKVLEECRENDAKAIVFSEWERMLHLVRELCERLEFGFAWHTGSVPQRRRRAEINAFKSDPNCRVFLSTDSGSTGLNLQNASVVINCDLPWNPARLEQRIARAWRKHQTRPVTVINLIAENTIEHRMLETLANKQALADGVLDLKGDLKEIKMRGGRQAFLAKLQQLMATTPAKPEMPGSKPVLPADRALAFSRRVHDTINGALIRCEERYPNEGAHSVLFVVVDGNSAQHRARLEGLHAELFGPDKSDPLAPVRLEVIDRATDEALQRLIAAGLIAGTTRASRPLYPAEEAAANAPLSAAERAKADGFRAQTARKLKMAKLLGEGGLDEEARVPLRDAIHNLGRALAVESSLPEPASLADSLLPPVSLCWNESLPLLRSFVAEDSQPWKPVADALSKMAPARNP